MQSPRCHCERGEAIQNPSAETAWIASLRGTDPESVQRFSEAIMLRNELTLYWFG